jgi:cytochrome bd-type quinol oxidase subunit 2
MFAGKNMTENPYSSPMVSSKPKIAVASNDDDRSWSTIARRAVRILSIISAAIFLVLVTTGLARRSQPAASSVHKWSGHALVIAVWCFVPFSVAVGLQSNFRWRPGLAIAQTIVLLSLLCVVLLASFTGYLGPSYNASVSEETRNRFTVLHQFALPTLVATLLTASYWLFGPHRRQAAESSGQPESPMTRVVKS